MSDGNQIRNGQRFSFGEYFLRLKAAYALIMGTIMLLIIGGTCVYVIAPGRVNIFVFRGSISIGLAWIVFWIYRFAFAAPDYFSREKGYFSTFFHQYSFLYGVFYGAFCVWLPMWGTYSYTNKWGPKTLGFANFILFDCIFSASAIFLEKGDFGENLRKNHHWFA